MRKVVYIKTFNQRDEEESYSTGILWFIFIMLFYLHLWVTITTILDYFSQLLFSCSPLPMSQSYFSVLGATSNLSISAEFIVRLFHINHFFPQSPGISLLSRHSSKIYPHGHVTQHLEHTLIKTNSMDTFLLLLNTSRVHLLEIKCLTCVINFIPYFINLVIWRYFLVPLMAIHEIVRQFCSMSHFISEFILTIPLLR